MLSNSRKRKMDDSLREELEPAVLCTFGMGDAGQLGHGADMLERKKAKPVSGLEHVTQVASAGLFTLCLSSSHVYSFGCNDEGALGRKESSFAAAEGSEEEDYEYVPRPVEDLPPVCQIVTGESWSAALTPAGTVYIWGSFRAQETGNIGVKPGQTGPTYTPQCLELETIVKLAAGCQHLLLLTDSGLLYSMGGEPAFSLGRYRSAFIPSAGNPLTEAEMLTPTAVRPSHAQKRAAGRKRASLARTGRYTNIWAGGYVSFAQADNGDVYCWGLNGYHQLGLGDDDDRDRWGPKKAPDFCGIEWKKICPGDKHLLALDVEGNVYSLGAEEYGKLGLGEHSGHALRLTKIPNLPLCVDIAASNSCSFAVTRDGDLYSWGAGSIALGHLTAATADEKEKNYWVPEKMNSREFENRKVLSVTAAAQHTCVLLR